MIMTPAEHLIVGLLMGILANQDEARGWKIGFYILAMANTIMAIILAQVAQ